MTKKEYLDLLSYYLRDLPKPIVDDIVRDYDQHFEEGLSFGKSEEEIAQELGSPLDLAREHMEGEKHYYKNVNKQRKIEFSSPGIGSVIKIFFLIIFAPVIFSLFMALIGVIIGLVAALGGITVGNFVAAFAFLGSALGLIHNSYFFSLGIAGGFHTITKICISLACFGLGVLSLSGFINLIKFSIREIKKTFQVIIWKLTKEGRENE